LSKKRVVAISEPSREDFIEIKALFKSVLFDLYQREGIFETFQETLQSELEEKEEALLTFFENSNKMPYFLMAKCDGKCVGTIALTVPNTIIAENMEHFEIEGPLFSPEVASVFVLPEFQGMGVGVQLLEGIKTALKDKRYHSFYLDCGYTKSQPYWNKQLGEATKVLNNYWGDGMHHMIWKKDL
jgi:GNAT superfamily N-acetyltransferase